VVGYDQPFATAVTLFLSARCRVGFVSHVAATMGPLLPPSMQSFARTDKFTWCRQTVCLGMIMSPSILARYRSGVSFSCSF